MRLNTYTTELDRLVQRASVLLGEPALPLELDWDVEASLRKVARRVRHDGLDVEPALLCVNSGRGGRYLRYGATEFVLAVEGELDVRLVSFELPGCGVPDFWAVGESDYRRFYRALRHMVRKQRETPQPFLSEDTRQKLWDNTLGFLLRENALLERYNIPKKRGVLLTGEPGNGKTMACRWLYDQCARRGISWGNVSMEDFEAARSMRRISTLFTTDGPGVILFDDFDLALTRRDRAQDQFNQSTFLSELDGVKSKTGVVYLFTTNMPLDDIDPAMRRPGRIDVFLSFPKPDAQLRQRYIQERWPAEGLACESLEEIVTDTEGMSFAELEEARKLFVLRYLDEQRWNWRAAQAVLRRADMHGTNRPPIGFSTSRREHRTLVPQTAATAENVSGGESQDSPPFSLVRGL